MTAEVEKLKSDNERLDSKYTIISENDADKNLKISNLHKLTKFLNRKVLALQTQNEKLKKPNTY